MKIKKIIALMMVSVSLIGCSKQAKIAPTVDVNTSSWEEVVAASNGTVVTYYGWGGDDKVNTYIDQVVAQTVKEKYNITLKRVGMDITEIMTKLLTEKEQHAEGTMDIVWLNGENFYTSKTNGLLHGEFLSKLPSAKSYLDLNNKANQLDFGVPIEGMEAPLGRAQFVMLTDTKKVGEIPTDVEGLMKWVKANPGKFTYPSCTDFTGSAFVRNIIFQLINPAALQKEGLTKEQIAEIIKPGIDYLEALKPYLWREGTTYPATYAQLSNMFADGEVAFCMTYTANGVSKMIEEGVYPETTQAFVLEKGTLGNTHFLTIPQNAKNEAGAMIVINEMLSPKMQAEKMNPNSWGDITSLDYNKLSKQDKALFEALPKGKGALPIEKIGQNIITEPYAKYVPVIEKIWEESILR